MDVLYGLAKDFVFKDAVAFLKGKKALTSEEYRLLDDESRAKAFTVSDSQGTPEELQGLYNLTQ